MTHDANEIQVKTKASKSILLQLEVLQYLLTSPNRVRVCSCDPLDLCRVSYEEQLALAMQRRLRTSQSSPGVVPVGASPVPGDNISSDHAQAPEFREGGVDKDADVVDADGGGGDAHLPSTQVGSSAEEGSWPYSGGGGGAFEETEIIRPPQGQDDCEMLLVRWVADNTWGGSN